MKTAAACSILVLSALVSGCRTPTYDERMRSVDDLYAVGQYEQAAGTLGEATGGALELHRAE